MSSKHIKREIYVALHSQSGRFRLVKWLIIMLITYALFLWKGWPAAGSWIVIGIVFGLSVHFFFRAKTNAWRRSWGPFKPIKTPFD